MFHIENDTGITRQYNTLLELMNDVLPRFKNHAIIQTQGNALVLISPDNKTIGYLCETTPSPTLGIHTGGYGNAHD